MKSEAEKSVTVLALVTAICLFGDAMLYIVLPMHWESFGLTSLWEVGVLLSVNRLIRLPLNPIVGWLYNRIHKRSGILIAVSLTIVTTLSYGIFNGFWLLLVTRCLWGVAWAFLRLGGFLTILEVSTKENRGFLIGKYNGIWGLGGLVGMLAGGLLADIIGVDVVSFVFAFCALLCIPAVIHFIPENPTVNKGAQTNQRLFKDIKELKSIIPVMLTGMIIYMVFFGALMSTLSLMIQEMYAANLTIFGITIGVATLTGIIQATRWGWEPILAPKVGRISDGKTGRTPLLITALLLGAGLFFILTLDFPILVWIGVLLCLQLMWTVTVTLSDTLAADAAAISNKLALMTTYTVIVDVGAAIGPVLSFTIIEFYNVFVLYWITGGLLFVLGLYWCLIANKKPKNLL